MVCDNFLVLFKCLQFAISGTASYENIIFKPKQVVCLESLFLNRDTMAILPTGYGKSITFHLLPGLISRRNTFLHSDCGRPIVLVVSPLNSLMDDQVTFLNKSGIDAAILTVKHVINATDGDEELSDTEGEAEPLLQANVDRTSLELGQYSIVFCHPEAFISSSDGYRLRQSKVYAKNVQAVVIDEAHCILEW